MKRFLYTALLALLILAVGVSALYGVRALLPDYTKDTHVYSAAEGQLLPVFEERKELILYPWKELTYSETFAGAYDAEVLFYELADAFALSVSLIELDEAVLLYNSAQTMVGVRNVRAYTACFEEYPMETEKVWIGEACALTLSAAFDGEVFCWFCIETEDGVVSDEKQAEGYAALCELAKAPFANENVFSRFAYRYQDASERLDVTGGVETVFALLKTGGPACDLYDGRAYFRYTSEGGTLTLICDPTEMTVVGFSLETY